MEGNSGTMKTAAYHTNTKAVKFDTSANDQTLSQLPDSEGVPGSKDDPFRAYRFSKQFILLFCWVCIGLFNEIIGPTLPDLTDKLGVDYEKVSSALAAKSIGYATGSVIGGFIHEKFYKHSELIIACALWLASVATLVVPFGNQLPLVATMFAFSGVADGIINTGGNTMVMDLWGVRAAGPMHSLHFAFGVGAMIAPQIAKPFLSPDEQTDDDSLTTGVPTTTAWNSTVGPVGVSRVEICYSIIAIIVFVYGFVVLGMYLRGPPKGFRMRQPSGKWKEMLHPSLCGHGYAFFAVELLVVLFLYFVNAVGGERTMSKFLFSYAIDTEVQFTKDEASSLQTAFWGCFTAGRLLGIPVARFVPIWLFIMCDVIGIMAFSVAFSFCGYHNSLALWITSSFLGLFISVAFPNGMAWSNIYLSMNNISVMILSLGGACGGFIYQYLSGYLYDKDPKNLGYVMLGYGSAMVLTYVIMQILATVHGRKILRNKKKKKDDIDDYIVSKDDLYLGVENANYVEEITHM